MMCRLKKKFAVFVAIIYSVTILVGCNSTGYIVKDYAAYVGNLFSYFVTGNDDYNADVDSGDKDDSDGASDNDLIESEHYDGLINIGKYKFDSAKAFFGNYAYAERNGVGFLIDRGGNCVAVDKNSNNTSPDIVLDKILYDKLIVKSGDKYGVLSLEGKVLLENIYDRIEINGNVIAGIKDNRVYVYKNDEMKFATRGEQVSILSEDFVQVDNRVLSVYNGNVAMIGENTIWNAHNNGVVLVASPSGRFGYCSYPSGEMLIAPKYFIASSFYNGIACVAEYDSNFSNDSFYDYQLLIDIDDRIVFDFDMFKDKYLPTEITVFPRFGNYCVVRFGSGSNVYGAVKFADNIAEYLDLDNEPDGCRFYGDNYIIKENGAVFSVKENAIISEKYSKVESICDSLFLASCFDGTYSILGSDLTLIADSCDSVETYENTILICKNSKYAYYMIDDKSN